MARRHFRNDSESEDFGGKAPDFAYSFREMNGIFALGSFRNILRYLRCVKAETKGPARPPFRIAQDMFPTLKF